MRIASALSSDPDTRAAAREAVDRSLDELGERPNLVFAFHSPHHLGRVEEAAAEIIPSIGDAALLGCTTQAVIGDGREVEAGPALSVWAAALPGVRIEPFSLTVEDGPDGPAVLGMPLLGEESRAVILLGDPFSFPVQVLARIDDERPELPVIGGMASGGMAPGRHALISGTSVGDSGAVGVVLSGDLAVETVVAQGCRPIGAPYVVTASEQNVIRELAGKPPLERLRSVLTALPPEDRARAQQGLHVGLAIDEYKAELGQGDFLIRNVIGGDPESGAIAVGDYVHVGQTVQFQVRDAEAADQDLAAMLERRLASLRGTAAGALLFTCNGRGQRLFGTPDHDVQTVRSKLGHLPVAGMFCGGEVGPVGGRTFLHGFTASIALFVESPA
ncbi:MAG: FIST signal transduction protein [Actinomycetota bacterium]